MSNPRRKIYRNAGTDSGMTQPPLNIVLAAKNNENDLVVEILKRSPERINARDSKSGMTALHWVGANMNYELGEILFSQKEPPVDPFIKDNSGRYAFDLANDRGNQRVIDLFFKNLPEEPDGNVVDFDLNGGP